MKKPISLCIMFCKLKTLVSHLHSNSNHFSSSICQHKRAKKSPLAHPYTNASNVLFKVDRRTFPNLRPVILKRFENHLRPYVVK